MRFTTSKEARDPNADISSGDVEGIAIIVEESGKMLSQFLRDNIFPNFLLNNFKFILIDLDNTVDSTIDVIMEHILNSHD